MPTLHVEHAVSDFDAWKSAFDEQGDERHRHGVLGHRVQRPVDDPAYVLIELDFASEAAAARFEEYLRSSDTPAVVGRLRTRILQLVEE